MSAPSALQQGPRGPIRIPWADLENQTAVDAFVHIFDHLQRMTDLLIQLQQNKLRPLTNVRLSKASDTSITLQPYSQNREKLRTILFQVTSTATLTLGAFVLTSIPAGIYIWNDLDFLLDMTDARTLTQASAGQIAFSLTGENLADTNILQP